MPGKGAVDFADLWGLELLPGHLGEALALFERQYHTTPAALGIVDDKHNESVIAEAKSQGFTVIHEPKGMLAFEIWMYTVITCCGQ